MDRLDRFLGRYARTQRFTLGAPRTFRVADDGSRVAFLRSGSGTDPVNCLWVLDVDEGSERLVIDPAQLSDGADAADVPDAELAMRERRRDAGGGIVSYDADSDLTRAVVPIGGRLFLADLLTADVRRLEAAPGAFDPRLDPAGERVAYVAGARLRVTEVSATDDRPVIEGEGTVSWGSAEFVAAEEMGRTRGHWWGPDGASLLVERVDVAPVETWHIASPVDPGSAPRQIRYPRAGTANAEVGLAIVGLDGSRVDVDWSQGEFEYLAAASWAPRERPTLTVQTRDQRSLAVLDVDPATGATTEVHRVEDRHWVELVPGAPRWTDDGALLTVADVDGARRLLRNDEVVTPTDLQVRGLVDADEDHALVVATPDPTEAHLYRVGYDGVINQVTFGAGVHGAVASGGVIVESARSLDWPGARVRVLRDGDQIATIASNAEEPSLTPDVELLTVGERELRAALVLPGNHDGSPLPVLVDPYGGPHALRVQHARDLFLVPQWFAENGFAVLVVDGRGTPARGPEWERAVTGDLAGPVLDDQVDALHAAAAERPELDLTRVAIRGWSFGGYLAALAVLRRPDVFHAAVAGAPVTDWRLYDTHYTERYLGHPDADGADYDRCQLIDEAASLTRPLLLIHGLADDNVVAAHTLRLSRALLEAGRPHRVLPLSGVTHMTPQEVVAENLLRLQLDFLRDSLPPRGP